MTAIVLDEKIREHVLLPIFIVVLLTSLLRSNLLILFKVNNVKVDMKEVRTNSMLGRCRVLRQNAQFLGDKAFRQRKAFFVKDGQGFLVHNVPKPKDPMEALSKGGDPMAAMGMMKNQVVFMVSQGLLATWVSTCFSGFLVAKTPFPMTFQFKSFLQRGVDVSSLEPGYVSSLCWYIFVMMSSHSVLAVLQFLFSRSGDELLDDPMMAMMGGMAGGMGNPMMPGGGPDMSKVFKQEQEGLEMIQHESILDNIEVELRAKWKREKY